MTDARNVRDGASSTDARNVREGAQSGAAQARKKPRRIVAPTASLTLVGTAIVNQAATVTVSATPGSGSFVSGTLSWGDGDSTIWTGAPAESYTHTYTATGIKTATLTIVNSRGDAQTAQATIDVQVATVNDPPPAAPPTVALSLVSGQYVGESITIGITTTGAIASWSLAWGDSTIVSGSGTPPATVAHAFAAQATYRPSITVTSTDGLTGTSTIAITVSLQRVGSAVTVPSGGDLQAAIDAAQPGDEIVLEAGAVFSGNFTLPNTSGTSVITIKSSGAYPAAGVRVAPADASAMAAIQSPNYQPAIQFLAGAHNWRLEGLEVKRNLGVQQDAVINVGYGDSTQTLLSQVPHDIVIDRCYIHGESDAESLRGIGLHGATVAITNCYISEFKIGQADSRDSQAIVGWNGPGPYTITNNYLEASGENLMFGGGQMFIPNATPSDIVIQGNTFAKQTAWNTPTVINGTTYPGPYVVKNLLELKHAQRVRIEQNIFEYCWQDAQQFAFALTPRSTAAYNWAVVKDITIQDNTIRHVANVFNVLSQDQEGDGGAVASTITIQRNLCYDVSAETWGKVGESNGKFLQLVGPVGVPALVVDHNTCITAGAGNVAAIYGDGAGQHTGSTVTNNLFGATDYGIGGTGTSGSPALSVSTYFPSCTIQDNVFIGSSATGFPDGNFFPATTGDVGFTDYAGGDYSLTSGSAYHNAASDGTDIGYVVA